MAGSVLNTNLQKLHRRSGISKYLQVNIGRFGAVLYVFLYIIDRKMDQSRVDVFIL